jgi:hypothetical protein
MKRLLSALFALAIGILPLGAQTISGNTNPLGARTTASPANPTGTTSLTGVMMGMAGTITPKTTGNVLFLITFGISNNTASDGCSWIIKFGTGSAPANAAAPSGTSAGALSATVNNASTAAAVFGAAAEGYATGLVVNTAYWYDIDLTALTGGTCSLNNVTIIAIEQ